MDAQDTAAAPTAAPFKNYLTVGTIDTGHARRAVVTVEIEYDAEGELHITADAKRPGAGDIDGGGQMQDTLRGLVEQGMKTGEVTIEYRHPWDAARLTRLCDLWDRWHLNHMRPECEHQRELGWRERTGESVTIYAWQLSTDATKHQNQIKRDALAALQRGETVTLEPFEQVVLAAKYWLKTPEATPPSPLYEPLRDDSTLGRHKEQKLLGWLRQDEHPDGMLGKPCPECGYCYGTKWLHEEIPADVLAELRRI